MADLLKSLFKRIQEGASELGEAINGDRIERSLDEDIRAIDLHLHQARRDSAAMKAQRIVKEDEVKQAKVAIATTEAEIVGLLARRRKTQARALAAQAIQLQDECLALRREGKELQGKEVEFAELITELEQKLRRAKHQLGTLRAAAGIQRAQAAVAKLQPGPAPYPESAQASAQRARQRVEDGEATDTPKPRSRRKSAATDPESAINALIDRLSPSSPAAAVKRATRKSR